MLYIIVERVIYMNSVISAIQNTVPISLFNKGLAGKIFEEVKQAGAKVVIKNNVAECVLLSPQEYVALMDAVNDAKLLSMAVERMEHFNAAGLISEKDVLSEFGINDGDLDGYEEVEIE